MVVDIEIRGAALRSRLAGLLLGMARRLEHQGATPDPSGWDDPGQSGAATRLRSLLSHPFSLVSVTRPDGNLLYQTPAVERVLGYAPHERVGRSAFEKLHPDDAHRARALFEHVVKTGESRMTELRVQDSSGAWRWFEAVAENMMGDPNIGGVVVNYHEITARKALEDRLRLLVEGVPAIVYTAGVGPNAQWTYVSPQIESILGFTPEEWQADSGLWFRRLHPGDRERVLADEERSIKGGGEAIEYRMMHRDGRVVWLRDEALSIREGDEQPHFKGVLVDVTKRKLTEEALRSSEGRFRTMFDSAPIGVDLVDLHARVIESNRALEEMLGYGSGELAGMTMKELTYPDDRLESDSLFEELASGRRAGYELEKRYLRKDGGALWASLSASLLRDENGDPEYIVGMIQDITDRKKLEQRLQHQAFHDSLTGLANRGLLEKRIERALTRKGGGEVSVGMMLVDVDNFKSINDSFGHPEGDTLLVEVARRIRDCLRPSDTAARLGGDEFAVLLNDVEGPAAAALVADRVLSAFAKPIELSHGDAHITVSIGIALGEREHHSLTEVLRNADVAMYVAKGAGKGRYEIFEQEMVMQQAARA